MIGSDTLDKQLLQFIIVSGLGSSALDQLLSFLDFFHHKRLKVVNDCTLQGIPVQGLSLKEPLTSGHEKR